MSRGTGQEVAGTAGDKQGILAHILSIQPIIPVITISDADCAVPLAAALRAGGMRVVEVMLRTPASEESIRRIVGELPDMLVGAGTVTEPSQLAAASRLGARFAVSPGSTGSLIAEANRSDVPLLPGAATTSEVMRLLEAGFVHQKFFPAEQSGGAAFLRALTGPLPSVRFCPTGGIDADNVSRYLACSNVACVGGSWVTPAEVVARRDWSRVEALARQAIRAVAPRQ